VSEKGDVLSVAVAARFAVVVMRVPGSQHMGDYVNGNAAKILGWLIAALMAAQAIALATGGISTWPIRLELGHPT
jgi:Mn2+/Fe2+ NRAMP family transporter